MAILYSMFDSMVELNPRKCAITCLFHSDNSTLQPLVIESVNSRGQREGILITHSPLKISKLTIKKLTEKRNVLNQIAQLFSQIERPGYSTSTWCIPPEKKDKLLKYILQAKKKPIVKVTSAIELLKIIDIRFTPFSDDPEFFRLPGFLAHPNQFLISLLGTVLGATIGILSSLPAIGIMGLSAVGLVAANISYRLHHQMEEPKLPIMKPESNQTSKIETCLSANVYAPRHQAQRRSPRKSANKDTTRLIVKRESSPVAPKPR